MKKKFVIFSICLLVIIGGIVLYLFTKVNQYNIILISIDSLRQDHMSLYGYSRSTTPSLDEFAQGAFVAKNYIATSYLTPSSEGSVHTGVYPHTNTLINAASKISSQTPTLAELLRSQGYNTAMFGNSPEFRSMSEMGNSFKRGFEIYKMFNRYDSTYINQAITWIDKNKKNPFFIWIPVGSVHFPYGKSPDYFVDKDYKGILRGDSLGYYTIGYIYDDKIYRNAEMFKNDPTDREFFYPTVKINSPTPLSQDDMQYIIDKYDDGILNTDSHLKPLLSYLESKNILENTIVIIQSEHGEDLNEHKYVMHYDIVDTTINTPLIVKFPHLKGIVSNEIISGVDIFNTIMDALHLSFKTKEGHSFFKLLVNKPYIPRSHAITTRTPLWETIDIIDTIRSKTEELNNKDNVSHFQDYAIRTKEWKLIHRASRDILQQYSWHKYLSGSQINLNEFELYNIKIDPYEQKNVYEINKANVRYLKDKLLQFEQDAQENLRKINSEKRPQTYF